MTTAETEKVNPNSPATNLAAHFHFGKAKLARITDADIEETVALINKAYAYQDSYKQAPRTNPQHLHKTAADNEFYIARQHHEIVGCVYVKRRVDAIHFGLLTVAGKLRGQGLGKALIQAVERYAKQSGAKKVELDYMSAAPWLKSYYERQGYTETGGVEHWGTIDLIHMLKLPSIATPGQTSPLTPAFAAKISLSFLIDRSTGRKARANHT